MNNQEMKARLQAFIAELEAPKEVEKPREKEWCVDGSGYITKTAPSCYLEAITAQGRTFYTEEEAELFRDKERLIGKMREEFGFEPKGDFGQLKYGINYDHSSCEFFFFSMRGVSGNGLFGIKFEIPEKAKACIEKYGDEIKRVMGWA